MQPIEDDLDIDLGYRYRSAAVILDGADDGRLLEPTRQTKGRPGTRAPHLVLKRNRAEISTLDLYGGRFVLLSAPGDTEWTAAARDAAHHADLELDIHQILEPGFAEAYGIGPNGAVLVRPDGIVAWRAQDALRASVSVIAQVFGQVLCRAPK
jgi:hypothetical protein